MNYHYYAAVEVAKSLYLSKAEKELYLSDIQRFITSQDPSSDVIAKLDTLKTTLIEFVPELEFDPSVPAEVVYKLEHPTELPSYAQNEQPF